MPFGLLCLRADRHLELVCRAHGGEEAEFGSGITACMEGSKVLLTIPGKGQFEYRSAVKAGLITVRGA